jgi:hypothetical protein
MCIYIFLRQPLPSARADTVLHPFNDVSNRKTEKTEQQQYRYKTMPLYATAAQFGHFHVLIKKKIAANKEGHVVFDLLTYMLALKNFNSSLWPKTTQFVFIYRHFQSNTLNSLYSLRKCEQEEKATEKK